FCPAYFTLPNRLAAPLPPAVRRPYTDRRLLRSRAARSTDAAGRARRQLQAAGGQVLPLVRPRLAWLPGAWTRRRRAALARARRGGDTWCAGSHAGRGDETHRAPR